MQGTLWLASCSTEEYKQTSGQRAAARQLKYASHQKAVLRIRGLRTCVSAVDISSSRRRRLIPVADVFGKSNGARRFFDTAQQQSNLLDSDANSNLFLRHQVQNLLERFGELLDAVQI